MNMLAELTPNAMANRREQAEKRGSEQLRKLVQAMELINKFDSLINQEIPADAVKVAVTGVDTLQGRTINLYIDVETLKPVSAALV